MVEGSGRHAHRTDRWDSSKVKLALDGRASPPPKKKQKKTNHFTLMQSVQIISYKGKKHCVLVNSR